jgi:hypothetical protein
VYDFIDVNAAQLNQPRLYYRLRQEDKDGGYTYSLIVPIQISLGGPQLLVKAVPNPFNNQLSFVITSNSQNTSRTDKAELYTIDGKLLYTQSIAGWTNNSRIQLRSIPRLANGMYVLKVHVNNEIVNIKVVKQ